MAEIKKFAKYEKGAYHWHEMRKSLKRFNAGLAARYKISEEVIIKYCKNLSTIVDIGCGDGYLTTRLAQIYGNATVIGFDIEELAIKLAIEQSSKFSLKNLSFIHGDVFEFMKNKKVDLIVATDVIEHLDNQEDFIKNCLNILKGGGFLFISTPIRIKEFPDDQYHIKEFFYDELRRFIEKFGFLIIENFCSHDYCLTEKYNKAYKFLGIGKIRLYKYYYNFLSIYFNKNVFEAKNSKLSTMQYLLAKIE
ncbi:MAG: methyltransferase domain-containing protein [Elusimicrobiota bacterium]|nr:methyltransferase domain-containing protein [Endomicrobiia bacterium]MDW8166785.1 methyltransferase domain-containing protein [Elusimicrobiota bacterium]